MISGQMQAKSLEQFPRELLDEFLLKNLGINLLRNLWNLAEKTKEIPDKILGRKYQKEIRVKSQKKISQQISEGIPRVIFPGIPVEILVEISGIF